MRVYHVDRVSVNGERKTVMTYTEREEALKCAEDLNNSKGRRMLVFNPCWYDVTYNDIDL